MALNAKQQRFVDEFLVDMNATQAAIRAGYSKKTARKIASENLTKPDIQDAITEAMAAQQLRTNVTQDRVVREYAMIAFADLGDYIKIDENTGAPTLNFSQLKRGDTSIIQKFKQKTYWDQGKDAEVTETELQLYSKTDALRALYKHTTPDKPKRIEVTGENGEPIEVDVVARRRKEGKEADLLLKEAGLSMPDILAAAVGVDDTPFGKSMKN